MDLRKRQRKDEVAQEQLHVRRREEQPVDQQASAGARSSVVTVTRERDGVALVHLNRPSANSYDKGFLDDLNAAIDEVRFDEAIRAAVLVSDLPRFFSAGADVNMFRQSSPARRNMVILHAHEILLKMERTPKVFVAAIGGHALGGGLEIALAADFRIAAEGDYRIGTPEVSLGVLPGNGGTQRLPRLIGRQKGLELLLSGKPVGPAEAHQLGIADRLVTAGRLVEEAVDFAAQFATGPTVAIGNIKTAAKQGLEMALDGGLTLEREAVWRLFPTADAQEGMAAFFEKRPPVWKGE